MAERVWKTLRKQKEGWSGGQKVGSKEIIKQLPQTMRLRDGSSGVTSEQCLYLLCFSLKSCTFCNLLLPTCTKTLSVIGALVRSSNCSIKIKQSIITMWYVQWLIIRLRFKVIRYWTEKMSHWTKSSFAWPSFRMKTNAHYSKNTASPCSCLVLTLTAPKPQNSNPSHNVPLPNMLDFICVSMGV